MRSLPAALVAVVLLLSAACGGSSDSTAGPHAGKGIVRGIQRDIPRVVIEHGEIPGFMKAMTMGFRLVDKGMVEGLELGQEVEFEASYENGEYLITKIHPLGPAPEPTPETGA